MPSPSHCHLLDCYCQPVSLLALNIQRPWTWAGTGTTWGESPTVWAPAWSSQGDSLKFHCAQKGSQLIRGTHNEMRDQGQTKEWLLKSHCYLGSVKTLAFPPKLYLCLPL